MPVSGTNLLDANVWLAAVVGDHFHHTAARDWFDRQTDNTCAFCRITQMAPLRHLTNAKIMGATNVCSQTDAWQCYERLLADARVVFLPEPGGLGEEFKKLTQSSHPRHAMWTDSYLAAFAKAGEHGVVTFDQDFSKFEKLNVTLL